MDSVSAGSADPLAEFLRRAAIGVWHAEYALRQEARSGKCHAREAGEEELNRILQVLEER